MNCFQLIFSPTGGTERVAKALTETWPHRTLQHLPFHSAQLTSF